MEKYFITEWKETVNVIDHTLEQINKHPHLRIYIGTDSQNFSSITRYSTAIVYRYGSRGAHYIHFTEEVPRIQNDYLRLFGEGVRTIETSEIITREIPIDIEALEFDYADFEKTVSTRLVPVFKGWAIGIGQKPVFKSGKMIATKAADHICRKNF